MEERTRPQYPVALGRWLAPGIRRLWRTFCSVRLALILILVLTGLTLIGTLVIQASADVRADPAEYRWWLDNPARERFGMWTQPMYRLGLFDVYHSLWFLGAGILLVINVLVCTLNRWKGVWVGVTGLKARLPEGFYQSGRNRISLSSLEGAPEAAKETVGLVLRRRRYRVLEEEGAGAAYLAADKNRYFRLGTFLVHFSIVLFILAFLIGSMVGFDISALMVPVGSVREVGAGTNLSLRVESFVDEYWPEGPPKDYRSDVVLYENGQEVKRGTIRVNHYMSYNGVRFYQAFFGQAAVMEVKDAEGRVLYDDGVALGWTTGKKPFQRPLGTFNLPGYTAYVINPAQGYFDPLIRAGQVRLELYPQGSQVPVAIRTLDQGKPVEVMGLTFTFVQEGQFSGFSASQDPGNPLIWLSSGLFILGVAMVFYFPHRQMWALCRRDREGKTEVVVRTTATRSFAVTSEMEGLGQELEERLGVKGRIETA